MKDVTVTIVIPTRNAGKGFKKLLDKIFAQEAVDYELIVIDSSSTDGTAELVKKYPAKLVTIDPSEFGHGRTRNFGAYLANGKYVVFLTQDSIPYNKHWLANLIKPFKDKQIAGVYGRQVPRADEKELDKHFFLSLYGDKDITWTIDTCTEGDNVFSDANSAIRRDLLLKYPYKDDIIVSEDYEWAFRIMRLGYKIFYSTEAKVVHSHTYNLRSLFKRNFDVGVSYKDIYITKQSLKFIKKGLKIYAKEIDYLIKAGKIHLIPAATIRDFIRLIAVNFGKQEHLFSKELKKKYLSSQQWYWI